MTGHGSDRTALAISSSPGAFLRNGGWNLAGLLIPVPIAIAVVPALLHGLGEVRFGLLTFAWAIMAYFTLFDLGLGRATTREIAAALSRGDPGSIGAIAWSSIGAHAVLGMAGFLTLAAVSGALADAFELDAAISVELRQSLLWLAASVPVLIVTGAFRGILEGIGRFDLVNMIRLPSSVWTYAAPWLVMMWQPRLPAVVGAIVVGRVLSLVAHATACHAVAPAVRRPVRPSAQTLRPMVVLGWWLTIGTIVLPLIAAWDRFVIGTEVSPEAVGRYAAPYEVVTKLWTFSAALMSAAFPLFTAAWAGDRSGLGALLRHSAAVLFLAVIPPAAIVIVTAPVLLPLWLGPGFGGESVSITRWLAAGVAASVVAQSGFTFLQACGKADWVARLQTIEAFLYVAVTWWVARRWGATGVAVVWACRAVVDCAVLLWAADAVARSAGSPAFSRGQLAGVFLVPASSLSVVGLTSTAHASPFIRVAAVFGALAFALAWAWRGLVERDARFAWRRVPRRDV